MSSPPSAPTPTWCPACAWPRPSWPTWAATPATRPSPPANSASPAVIGIQHTDGHSGPWTVMDVTVDGSRGRVYRGLLPAEGSGRRNGRGQPCPRPSAASVSCSRTSGQALAPVPPARLRAGLRRWACSRAEFMLGNVGVHPQLRWKPSTTANWTASSKEEGRRTRRQPDQGHPRTA